jgi:hypothetical protein
VSKRNRDTDPIRLEFERGSPRRLAPERAAPRSSSSATITRCSPASIAATDATFFISLQRCSTYVAHKGPTRALSGTTTSGAGDRENAEGEHLGRSKTCCKNSSDTETPRGVKHAPFRVSRSGVQTPLQSFQAGMAIRRGYWCRGRCRNASGSAVLSCPGEGR